MPSDEPTTLALITAIATTAAAGASIGSTVYSLTQGAPKAPSLPEIPAPPTATPATPGAAPPTPAPDLAKPTPTLEETGRTEAAALALRQRRGRASTILTGPGGLFTPPGSGVKTLLGQ